MDSGEVGRYWEANAEAWTRQVRDGLDVYRDVLNTPAFLAMLPPVAGLTGLDIGCGEGANTRALAERGARMTGIDIAPTFVEHARAAEAAAPLAITYRQGDATRLDFDSGTFDFAAAFMSLMDIAEPDRAIVEACRVIRPGGFFQISILHPCFVPPSRRNVRDGAGDTVAVEVADYFRRTDGDVERWWFTLVPEADRAAVAPFSIPRFHRTLSDWLNALVAAGFVIEELGEPAADTVTARKWPVVADTQVAPIFLHVRARRPS